MAKIRISGPVLSIGLGVAVLVGGLSVASGQVLAARRQRSQVLRDALELIGAVQRYERAYRRMPTSFNGYYDVEYGGSPKFPNRMVMNVLLARDAEGNRGHGLNPQQTAFITNAVARAGQSGLRKDFEWLDPWGVPYRLVLDTDNDRICNVDGTIHHAIPAMASRCALWSAGPDRQANTADDLLGWRMLYERERKLRR
jgi:hypothetical protein